MCETARLRNVFAADQRHHAPPHLVEICKSGKLPGKTNNRFLTIPAPRESAYCHQHIATCTGWNLKITWTKAEDYKTSRKASKHWNKYHCVDQKIEQIERFIVW